MGYWNALHLLDVGATSHSISAGVEPGKWNDIKIKFNRSSVKGYLDAKLISEVGGDISSAKALSDISSIEKNSMEKLKNVYPFEELLKFTVM